MAWVKSRRPDVSVSVTTANGSVRIDTTDLPAEAVLPLLREVLRSERGALPGEALNEAPNEALNDGDD
ncbi:hypothetical protein EBO15_22085 [Actinomadura harenae]|uniref:Uncharacterized protein n=1 Tax=Actinomadura harenae TaxID=2483351 RepID=A0A3M2LWF3_9ACTN|nr:hypothetical protein EBO15_22085 [Actinomadura harenae]